MALIAWDGLDHYASSVDMQQRFGNLQWNNFTNSLSFLTPGRAGFGKALIAGGGFYATLGNAVSKLTHGFAVDFNTVATTLTVQLIDAASTMIQLEFDINPTSGIVQAWTYNGVVKSTTPIQTGLNCLGPNGWYFVELQATCSATAGTVALRINGQAIASFPDLTGLDILNPSALSATFSQIRYYTSSGGIYLDDMYWCDGTTGAGSYPANSFLGDMRVSTLFPVGNNSVTWTPSDGGSDNWNMVAETAFDGDATYNRTNSAGNQDSFNFQAISTNVNQVVGVAVTCAVRKEDAGARTLAPVLLISGTTYQGTAVSVDVSYLYITSIWPINPHTSASWTPSDIASLKAGYLVVT